MSGVGCREGAEYKPRRRKNTREEEIEGKEEKMRRNVRGRRVAKGREGEENGKVWTAEEWRREWTACP